MGPKRKSAAVQLVSPRPPLTAAQQVTDSGAYNNTHPAIAARLVIVKGCSVVDAATITDMNKWTLGKQVKSQRKAVAKALLLAALQQSANPPPLPSAARLNSPVRVTVERILHAEPKRVERVLLFVEDEE